MSNKTHTLVGMDYCPGGELFMLLRAKKQLSIAETHFYAASILMGLLELHQVGIDYLE